MAYLPVDTRMEIPPKAGEHHQVTIAAWTSSMVYGDSVRQQSSSQQIVDWEAIALTRAAAQVAVVC